MVFKKNCLDTDEHWFCFDMAYSRNHKNTCTACCDGDTGTHNSPLCYGCQHQWCSSHDQSNSCVAVTLSCVHEDTCRRPEARGEDSLPIHPLQFVVDPKRGGATLVSDVLQMRTPY